MVYRKTILTILIINLLSFGGLKAETECFEKVSRSIFKFNMGFDRAILKPVAKGYNKLPKVIRKGTSNFTSNLGTLLSVPNYLLQGDAKGAVDASASFLINSTIGVLGLGNPAAALGLEKQKEDVGQTLATYGIGSGCYFVLPILGPTTIRDSVGMVADTLVDPFARVTIREKEIIGVSGSKVDYFSVKGASAIDFRADNMTNLDSLEKNSLDEYAAIKSLFLQNRSKKINNTFSSKDDDWEEFNK